LKILHCADIHLDSPMRTLLTPEKSKERKAELLKAFQDMVEYGIARDVEAVIIAGDLFDTNKVSVTAKNTVLSIIKKYPQVSFFYLKGNHDRNDFINANDEIPENLLCFGEQWTLYSLTEKIKLYGIEIKKNNSRSLYSELVADKNMFNIVVLHGQESKSRDKDKTEIISLKDLKNKKIDYLALGHVHEYKYEKLDSRGYYCYPGCLEARGFDECGAHGFVIIDIDEKNRTFKSEFVSMPIRIPYEVPVDITETETISDIIDQATMAFNKEAIRAEDMVKLVLTGETDFDRDINLDYIDSYFHDKFFAFKVKNDAKLKVDYSRYRFDESLKGEFIRTVEEQKELTNEEKAEIIRYGIKALMGEDLE